MKRLLKVSLDVLLSSFVPIIIWFLLGLLLSDDLINVFSLTYPIQFIGGLLRSVFGTGSNISAEKNKNKDEVYSSMLIGIFLSLIIVIILLLNVDNYINFMNMDINTYIVFTIYAIVQMTLRLLLDFILIKLYYENNNNLANRYSIVFNFLNLIIIVLLSIITKNYIVIISISLLVLLIYIVFILIKNISKFKFSIKILNWIKYDSVEVINNIFFFIIFMFGFSNAFEFGVVYAASIAFVNLITDAQWDVFDAITTVAKIDISKNDFDYKTHRNNAYKLFGLIFLTTIIMFVTLFWFYDLNFKITLLFLLFEVFCWLIYPLYKIKTCYLQIEGSVKKVSSNKIVSNVIRTALAFLKTPFCTIIGQICSALYQLVTINIMYKKHNRMNSKIEMTTD